METQSPKRSVRSSVQRMDPTVVGRDVPRRYDPPARRIPEGVRVTAIRARIICQEYAATLVAGGHVDRAATFLAPLLGVLEAIAFTGNPADLHSRAAIVDDQQDVAREQYRRGDLSRPQYRYHLMQQLRYTLAELRALEVSHV